MKSVCLMGPQRLAIMDQPIPQIHRDDEVLLEVGFCGICKSDIVEYTSGPVFCPQPGEKHPYTGVSLPICLGHEYSGTVRQVGSAVSRIKPGDRVCVNIAYGCREQGVEPLCHACTLNYSNACVRLSVRGLSALGGGLCQYVVLPDHCLHILPDGIPLEIGALIEPLSIAWHAVRVSGIMKGQTGLVIGADQTGLSMVLALQAHSVGRVIVCDPSASRRQQARDLGADHVIDPTKFSSTADLVATVSRLNPPFFEGVDVSFDCGGEQGTLDTALKTLRLGGTAVNLATWQIPSAVISPVDITTRERKYMGSIGFCNDDMEQVIEALSRGILSMERVRSLISSTVPIEDAIEHGFDALNYYKDKLIVVLVSPNGAVLDRRVEETYDYEDDYSVSTSTRSSVNTDSEDDDDDHTNQVRSNFSQHFKRYDDDDMADDTGVMDTAMDFNLDDENTLRNRVSFGNFATSFESTEDPSDNTLV